MKYVCIKTCQVRIGGKIHHIVKGEVKSMGADDATKNFQCLEEESHVVDFVHASEAELLEAKWKMSDAQEAMLAAYGKELPKYDGDKKKDVVDRIIDIRYRAGNDVLPNLPIANEASGD